MRFGAAAKGLAALLLGAGPALAADPPLPDCARKISAARYDAPTTRYPHGALGDTVEWGALELDLTADAACAAVATRVELHLPATLVFEDTAPRLADLDGDNRPEVLVVESHQQQGARLAVWGLVDDAPQRLAATPFIGTRFRWLAPVGAADLDGDGRVELAYVDRPHLARTLRLWRYDDGRLTQIAALPGVTNHRFGETAISGGIRNCGKRPQMILADADWRRVIAVTLGPDGLAQQALGPYSGPESLTSTLQCE